MGLFTKKADPISSKAKVLDRRIAELELQIKQLHRKLEEPDPAPAPRAIGHDHPIAQPISQPPLERKRPARTLAAREPIFESIEQAPPQGAGDAAGSHYNDLGVRKYDLPGAWRRLISYFHGPATHNPKLVSYLAAGSIRGLRPLRYEKRVARNRFVMMSIFFLAVLYWLIAVFWNHR